jgi:hypothetical protein
MVPRSAPIAHNYFAQDIDGMMFYNYYADTFSDD